MRNRWIVYGLIGLAFGVIDWYFQDSLGLLTGFLDQTVGSSIIGRLLGVALIIGVIWGAWLIPAVPVAVYEARRSRSVWRPALAAVMVWSLAVFSYYLTYTALLAFWGLPQMEHLLLSQAQSPTFEQEWAIAFRRIILTQFLDWIPVALVGGGIVGAMVGAAYNHRVRRRVRAGASA